MIPIVDLQAVPRAALAGSGGGGPGAAVQITVDAGVYVVVVRGASGVLLREGRVENLSADNDSPFFEGVYLAVRLAGGRVTLASAGAGDVRVWLLPVRGELRGAQLQDLVAGRCAS